MLPVFNDPRDCILYTSLRSPFARRVRVTFQGLGLPHTETVLNVFAPPPELYRSNPLIQVPTLVVRGFGALTESQMILEWAHEITGRVWSSDFPQRTRERQASALALGVMQGVVNAYVDSSLKGAPSAEWLQDYVEGVDRGLRRLAEFPVGTWYREGNPESGLSQAGWDYLIAVDYARLRLSGVLDFGGSAQASLQVADQIAKGLRVTRDREIYAATVPPA